MLDALVVPWLCCLCVLSRHDARQRAGQRLPHAMLLSQDKHEDAVADAVALRRVLALAERMRSLLLHKGDYAASVLETAAFVHTDTGRRFRGAFGSRNPTP